MNDRNQKAIKAKVSSTRLILAMVLLTISFLVFNLVFFPSYDYIYQQVTVWIVYIMASSYLSLRLFLTLRVFIRDEALLEEKNKHMQELKLFTTNLVKQRTELEHMLNETTQLSNKLLEQNLKFHYAQEKIFQEKEKFATLFETSQLIANSWDIEYVLPRIMELANKLVGFKTGRILLPEDDYLIIHCSYGYDKNKIDIGKIKIGEGITGMAALNEEIIIVEDVAKDERYIKEIENTKSEIALPLIYQGELLGILDIQDTEPFPWLNSHEETFDILVLFGNYVSMVLYNSSTYTKLKNSYVSIIRVLAKAIDAKDPYTHGHCERVKDLSLQIGQRLGLDPKDLEELEFAALLHDIGKIGLPESILYKPGVLSSVEFELIKTHSTIGANMIGDIPFLERTKRIIEQHHERIDGTGYPHGIKGLHMDFLAKIINVADSIDAMMTKRPYRSAQDRAFVLTELERCKGAQFDPLVVEVAKTIISEELFSTNMIG